ncbi:uncharacterized protein LOC101900997 [Musca domestica]|uniref:MORN repeat-containing protein 5 n=1 Tax=Musca domestica TaxID=7370 RepID=A0A1I8M4E0_MUSDO|nr:uncharacterized protein LOC101900997 [Musca domestica]
MEKNPTSLKNKKNISATPDVDEKDSMPNFSQNHDTKQRLITGSHYQGVWQNALQCPDGYGTYTYPDGSVYKGYFSRGHFNGYGTLHLAEPYNFSFRGTFLDGVLHEIEDMWFDDGLHVSGRFHKWCGDFSSWKYCCKFDRRYAIEQAEGLPPVGPYSFLTPEQPPRRVPANYIDVEEGLYNTRTAVTIQRPLPFNELQVVACKDEIHWILENCRKPSLLPQEISANVRQQIIKNNLDGEKELAEHDPCCNYESARERKRYFAKLCGKEGREAHRGIPCGDKQFESFSEDSMGSRLRDSSSICATGSLSDQNITVDVQEYLEIGRQYGNMKLGRNLEREALCLMSRAVRKSTT